MPNTLSVDPTSNVRTNVLHGYANYTYNLQLWAVTMQGFNSLANMAPGSEQNLLQGAELLISNGGLNNTEQRSPSFPTDFVIDNLEVESVIGNRAEGKGADALNLKFDIIEPYTVTLLDRLTEVVIRNGQGVDFKTLIYCMKITFLGYDSLGIPQVIEGGTKYIPFTMLNMTFSITSKGAVYKCQGIPQKNIAMTLTDNIVPFHIELKGRTVGELLGGKVTSSGGGNSARTDTTTSQQQNSVSDANLTKLLNDYEDKKASNKTQEQANRYYFELDPEFYNAVVLDTKKAEDDARSMSSISGSNGAKVAAGGRAGQITFDSTQGKFNAQAGTRLTDLLDNILKITDYMKAQVGDKPDKDKPVTMWKIFPKLTLKGYDSKTNQYIREVTYVIKKFDYYGMPHPNLGQKPPPTGCIVKKYDYLYTGENKDVMKLDIEYKVAFFEVFNALKEEYTDKANRGTGENPTSEADTLPDNTNDKSPVQPYRKPAAGIGPQQTTGAGTATRETIAVGELMNYLLDNAGDMIKLDLQIVGDPDWIQQDNILYDVNSLTPGQKTLSNGSISYFDSITCFQFNFKSPLKDYDDTTGMLEVGNSKQSAIFSGNYQVIRVVNNFSRGRFTQKLDNVRVRIQDAKQVAVNATSSGTTDQQPTTTALPG
jgi:hypothetical protein